MLTNSVMPSSSRTTTSGSMEIQPWIFTLDAKPPALDLESVHWNSENLVLPPPGLRTTSSPHTASVSTPSNSLPIDHVKPKNEFSPIGPVLGLASAVITALAASLYYSFHFLRRSATFEIKPQFHLFTPLRSEDGVRRYKLQMIDAKQTFSVFSVFNVEGLTYYRHSIVGDLFAKSGLPLNPPYRLRKMCLRSNRSDSIVPLKGEFGRSSWMGLINRIAGDAQSGTAPLTEWVCFLTSEKPIRDEKFTLRNRPFLLLEKDLEILKDSIDISKVIIEVDNPLHDRRVRTLQSIAQTYYYDQECKEHVHFTKIMMKRNFPTPNPPLPHRSNNGSNKGMVAAIASLAAGFGLGWLSKKQK